MDRAAKPHATAEPVSGDAMASAQIDVRAVQRHYDRLSGLYHWLWGEHIHHGIWRGARTPAEAQLQLIERLAARAGIPAGAEVLDVGCGLGGSSLWLASERGCSVLGITISPRQVKRATRRAAAAGLQQRVRFEVQDANDLDVLGEAFDVVWVIECSEHLQDKARFIAQCSQALRPGGVLAVCAWLAGETDSAENRRLTTEICDSMLCPSLARMSDYQRWMQQAGLQQVEGEEIGPEVKETWSYVAAIGRRPLIRLLQPFVGAEIRRFVRSFEVMRLAFETGAMGYGMLTARKARPEAIGKE